MRKAILVSTVAVLAVGSMAAPTRAASGYDVTSVEVGFALTDVAIDPGVHRAFLPDSYPSHEPNGSLAVLDTTDDAVVPPSIGGVGFPLSVAVDPATHRAYALTGGAGVLYVVDTTSKAVVAGPIDVGGERSRDVALDPAEHRAYVVNTVGRPTVSVVDTTTNAVVKLLRLRGTSPDDARIGVDTTAHRAFVTNSDSDTVTVINTTTDKLLGAPIKVGGRPTGVAVDPIAHRAYVANALDDTVSVIDTTTKKVLGAPLDVGDLPIEVAVDPVLHRLYVSNRTDGTVSVIDTRTGLDAVDPISGVYRPGAIAVDPSTHKAYVVSDSHDRVYVLAPHDNQAQTITFTSKAPATPRVGGRYRVTASGGGSGNPVTFSLDPSSGDHCTLTDNADSTATVKFAHVGACVINADQAAGSGYDAAPRATQSLTVSPARQQIVFTSQPPSPARVGTTYDVYARGGASGQPVTFSTTSAACTVGGSSANMATVRFRAAGQCVIHADQAGSADDAPAKQASQSVTVVANR